MGDDGFSFDKLPLRDLGFKDMPAVPLDIRAIPDTLVRLGLRAVETKQAVGGLSNVYSIDGHAAPAHTFLFGPTSGAGTDADPGATKRSLLGRLVGDAKEKLESGVDRLKDAVEDSIDGVLGRERAAIEVPTPKSDRAKKAREALHDLARRSPEAVRQLLEARARGGGPELPTAPTHSLMALALEKPEDFAISWTNAPPVFRDSAELLEPFSRSLDDAEAASRAFWPTLAGYGLPYNLIIAEKVGAARAERLGDVFGRAWSGEMESLRLEGRLYVIDLTIFEGFKATEADGAPRFTPSTLTLLRQDPETKLLEPIAVRVAGQAGDGAQYFLRDDATPGAWLYALQAAKTSITVFGIWLGHVYPWHLVSAALFMTAAETLTSGHPVRAFLEPQSDYVIAFDNVLLALWRQVAPPTSLTSVDAYLELNNAYAKGRKFFDDDPGMTLERLGITAQDFTAERRWDAYPIVGTYLDVWQAASAYATSYVEAAYADDAAVAGDTALQKWIDRSGDPDGGNVRGLPRMDSRAALARVLTSLLYRTTVHGMSRLAPAANPGLTFVSNFPPTLQEASIPSPSEEIGTRELLRYLPQTGTIGKMVTFYYTFTFSAPYEPMLPIDGLETDLFFGDDPKSPENAALIRFRRDVLEIYERYAGSSPPRPQWPRNIET